MCIRDRINLEGSVPRVFLSPEHQNFFWVKCIEDICFDFAFREEVPGILQDVLKKI